MATRRYKSFLITVLARAERMNFWTPYVRIASYDSPWTVAIMKAPPGIHSRKQDAEEFGFRLGEIWIDGYG